MSLLVACAFVAAAVPAVAAPLTHPDNTWVALAALPQVPTDPIYAIAVSPSDPNTVLVGTEEGSIFRSIDGGGSWAQTAHGAGRAVLTIQFSPFKPGLVFAGTRGSGLWRSADGGATWSRDPGLPSPTVRALGFAKSVMLAGTDSGLYASRDGSSWSAYLSFKQLSLSAVAVAAVNDPAKLVAGGDGSRGNEVLPLYTSLDGGITWNLVKSLGSATMVAAAAAGAVPANADSRPVVVGTNAGAFLSADGGDTWAQLTGLPALDYTSAAFVAGNPASFYLASDGSGGASGGVWASADSGQTFRSLNTPVPSVTGLGMSAEAQPTIYTATFRGADHAVMLWAYHDAGGSPVAPAGGVPAVASVPAASTAPATKPEPAITDLRSLLIATETPYVALGALALLVLMTALVLQVRRGREK